MFVVEPVFGKQARCRCPFTSTVQEREEYQLFNQYNRKFYKLLLETDVATPRTGRGESDGPRIDEGRRGSLKENIVCDRMAIISFLHVVLSVHLQWSPHMVPFTLGGTFNRPRGYFSFRCSEAKQMKAVAYL